MYGSKKLYQQAKNKTDAPTPPNPEAPTFLCAKCKRLNTTALLHMTVALDEAKSAMLHPTRVSFYRICLPCGNALKAWIK